MKIDGVIILNLKLLLGLLILMPLKSISAQIEVGFSTDSTALPLIINSIDNANSDIVVAAYSFTSKPISVALLNAFNRGLSVKVVADKKANSDSYTAITFLMNHKIPVCLTDQYAAMHNKFMVIDSHLVQTGSFNYTSSAVKRNAENIIIIDDKKSAVAYKKEFTRLYQECLAR